MSEQEFFDRSISEEESLFARDFDGQLVRVDPVTEASLRKPVKLKIDGHEVEVFEAVPLTDAQGNILHDAEGRVIPRPTTVYDAAAQCYAGLGLANPIPVLCHQDHLNPVAVCRVCSVGLSQMARGSRRTERKLFPACQLRVDDKGMEVHTVESPDETMRKQVREAVGTLTTLLAGDHLLNTPSGKQLGDPDALRGNELAGLARRFDVTKSNFPERTNVRGRDDSSSLVVVDHEACILCDRCVRACDEVKQNHIIGRTKKGFVTQIGFDLDEPMGESNCVACGECMVNCPTGAMTLHPEVLKKAKARDENRAPNVDVLTAEEIKRYPLFASMSYKFLEWNTGAVVRRTITAEDVANAGKGKFALCRQGDPGRTAFIVVGGSFGIRVRAKAKRDGTKNSGFKAFFDRLFGAEPPASAAEMEVATVGPGEIVGEMTCLSHYPRAATIVPKEPGEVLEINRNILHYLLRDKTARHDLLEVYRKRALSDHLRKIPFLAAPPDAETLREVRPLLRPAAAEVLDELIAAGHAALEAAQDRCAKFLAACVELVRVDPGEVIFSQGERADYHYQVRLGFVRFSYRTAGQDRVIDYFGPGKSFGEIGLLTKMGLIPASAIPPNTAVGVRTASCAALDDVELVRLSQANLEALMAAVPEAEPLLVAEGLRLLKRNKEQRESLETPLDDFLKQGLFNAQRLLVLDLESCTRCDECTRACSDSHSGIVRLIRDGQRFDKYLVAGACRSCTDPYCLVGCPVDAIHREPRRGGGPALEIVISDQCIGCGLCSRNCPYGNINMHPNTSDDPSAPPWKAATCDLCQAPDGKDTSCVYACPHEAAERISGADLWRRVNLEASQR